jgi:hypothetical protein
LKKDFAASATFSKKFPKFIKREDEKVSYMENSIVFFFARLKNRENSFAVLLSNWNGLKE